MTAGIIIVLIYLTTLFLSIRAVNPKLFNPSAEDNVNPEYKIFALVIFAYASLIFVLNAITPEPSNLSAEPVNRIVSTTYPLRVEVQESPIIIPNPEIVFLQSAQLHAQKEIAERIARINSVNVSSFPGEMQNRVKHILAKANASMELEQTIIIQRERLIQLLLAAEELKLIEKELAR